ncbi:MAG: hypothetical protein N2321_04130 [Melioribacteraceae bacterium]|nr:hypothetical protein [Melioribacteraceae bacterium]
MKTIKITFLLSIIFTFPTFGKNLITEFNTTNSISTFVTQSIGKYVSINDKNNQLKYFISALSNSNNKQVRIAHFGDSIILGDIITEYLREKFQQRFGGQGVGFLNIVSDDNRMRRTTVHTYSDDWEYISFLTRNQQNLPVGISGALAIPKTGSWVKYEANPIYKSSSGFSLIKIFYRNADKTSQIQYSIDDGNLVTLNLKEGDVLQKSEIKLKTNAKKFYMKFISGKQPIFYGVSLETSNNGVYVDNFPMRGNSGSSLSDISEETLKQFNIEMHYDLIILNYGANVSSSNKGIFTVYENKMVNVIEKFKKAFPETSFLIISSADRTQKVGSTFKTNPDVNLLIEAQKRIAEKTNVAFWNLQEVQGGADSMDDWVNASPPLALKDYAHFTYLGGEKIADFLFNALLEFYKK